MVSEVKYQRYIKNQITRAESKWARKPGHELLFQRRLHEAWKQVKDLLGEPLAIGCMGVRSGTEMFSFKNFYRKATIDGVDITKNIETIRLIPEVYVHLHDFNDLPKEWGNKFDLVFSNSIDHAFKVEDTIKEWRRVTKDGGFMMIQFSVTPKNLIEHSFKDVDIEGLFAEGFEVLRTVNLPEENLVMAVVKVIK